MDRVVSLDTYSSQARQEMGGQIILEEARRQQEQFDLIIKRQLSNRHKHRPAGGRGSTRKQPGNPLFLVDAPDTVKRVFIAGNNKKSVIENMALAHFLKFGQTPVFGKVVFSAKNAI